MSKFSGPAQFSEIFLTLKNFALKNVDWRCSGATIINFEVILRSIQHTNLVFLFIVLNNYLPAKEDILVYLCITLFMYYLLLLSKLC